MTTRGEAHHADALDRPRLAVVRSALRYAVFLSHGLNGSKSIGERQPWPTLWQAIIEDYSHNSHTDDPASHVCALVYFGPFVVGSVVCASRHDQYGVALPTLNNVNLRQINVDRTFIDTRGQRKADSWQRILPPLRHGLRVVWRARPDGRQHSARAGAGCVGGWYSLWWLV